MKNNLDCRNGFLCVVTESETSDLRQFVKRWYPILEAQEAEVQALIGRPVTEIDSQEGIYVDEEGNVYQVANKGETKAIDAQEIPCGRGELETLLVASLQDSDAPNPRTDALKRGPGRYREKKGGKRAKQKSAENGSDRMEPLPKSSAENGQTVLEAAPLADVTNLTTRAQLNLRKSSPKSAAGSATSRSAASTNVTTTRTSPQPILPAQSATS